MQGDALSHKELEHIRRSAMKYAGIGLCRVRDDGTIVFADEVAQEILRGSQPGTTESAVVAAAAAEMGKPPRNIREFDVPVEGPARERKWISCSAYLDEEILPREKHIQCLLQDVTDRKHQEDDLERERRFFRHLIQHSTAPTFVLNSAHQVIIWNKACEQLTGVRESEVLGTQGHWRAFYDQQRPCLADLLLDGRVEDLPRYYSLAGPCPHMPEGLFGEGWFENLGGKKRYLVFNAVPLPTDEGQPKAVIETLHDFTEAKAANEMLQRKEEEIHQMHKMEAIGRLAGGIAHGFNNLLTSILGYSRILRNELGQDHPLLREVEQVIGASERAANLTRQLLSFSRKQLVRAAVVPLNTVIDGILPRLRQSVGSAVRVETRLHPDAGNVMADVSMLEQILMNLALNARDAMPEGGTLSIETSATEFDEAQCALHEGMKPGRYVRWVIGDTGCGMSAEVRERIFEPFFTTKEEGPSGGLGLASVYAMVNQFYGHIDVQSTRGEGTRFTICLPQIQAPVPAPSRAAGGALPTGTETVLVAEDEELVRQLEVRILKSLGYHVLDAEDGLRALELGTQYAGPIHLLVTDVVMPHMGGAELAIELRKYREGIKVLYTSGFTKGALQDAAFEDGLDHVLLKPYTPEKLARKVRELLDA